MSLQTVVVPDLGTNQDVAVIELLVKVGQTVQEGDSLLTLESDKASMEVPSPFSGTVKKILVKINDKIRVGSEIMQMEAEGAAPAAEKKEPEKSAEIQVAETKSVETKTAAVEKSTPSQEKESTHKADESETNQTQSNADVHAGPAVRKLARELGIDLATLQATGPKNRILLEDVHGFVKNALRSSSGNSAGLSIAPAPEIDFSKFGEIELTPLSRIKKLTGINVHRSWVTVPHVTQFDEADITEMEAFRSASKDKAEKHGVKLTPLVFLMKAVVAALKQYPKFNSSLDASGENLILKKYFHIGVAVDTPNGLVVPVVRDVDQKGLFDLAKELADISKKAREKGLTPLEMQGSCFTISSLGGIGGTAFTPIVNTPDVAILGVSKAQMKPIYMDNEFVARLMLPLSLSYDHRVIDGADGARFTSYLANVLSDVRQLLF